MRERIAHTLLLIALFLLPWQTRWIFAVTPIEGGISEYGQFSVYVTQVLILLVVLLRGRPHYPESFKWIIQAAYFFLGVAFFSLGFSSDFSVGLAQMLHVISAFALFTVMCDVRTNIKQTAAAFVVGLLIPSMLGWWQVITGGSGSSSWFGLASKDAVTAGTAVVETASGRMLRAYGSLPHPNVLGGFLAVSLVILAWLVRFIHARRILLLTIVPVVFLSATLIVTFSRSAWLGIAVGFLALIGLMLFRRRLPPSRALPIIALGLLSVLSTLGFFYQQVFSRVSVDGRVEQISVVERTSQYSRFDDVFLLNPFLGTGPGAYPFALARLDPGGQAWFYQPVHNTFFLILGELGVIGAVALVYLLLRVDQVSSRSAKTAGGMLGLCLGIVLIVIGFFDHYLWSLWPGLALSVFALALIVKWSTLVFSDS